MSAEKPILILQMQRLGDLILTFPLILWLRRLYPDRPIWVVAERLFYEDMLTMSPEVIYFPWEGLEVIRGQDFSLCLNLSHRPEAAWLAGEVRAEEKIGRIREKAGASYIRGNWQLYRASLTHSNRHNRFHWADLNALDAVPLPVMAATTWQRPRSGSAEAGQIGLFLGASEREKRPEPAFWAALVRELRGRGLSPLLLGGPAEAGLGREVSALAEEPDINRCGAYSLPQLVEVFDGLSLLVTPDTGPMHLAVWTGLPALNLSMGPVNPSETGPYLPGHTVAQADMSCVGCWRCVHPRPYSCRERFLPGPIAFLAGLLALGQSAALSKKRLAGLRLSRSDRTASGLYALPRIDASLPPQAREGASRFWEAFFGAKFGLWDIAQAQAAWTALALSEPDLGEAMVKTLRRVSRDLAGAVKKRDLSRAFPERFWAATPPLLRPLSSYLHLFLQNCDYSNQGFRDALGMIEQLLALLG